MAEITYDGNMKCALCGREDKCEDFSDCYYCNENICESCMEDEMCSGCHEFKDVASWWKKTTLFDDDDDVAPLTLKPSSYIDSEGRPYYHYNCGSCGKGLASWASKCCSNDVKHHSIFDEMTTVVLENFEIQEAKEDA
jgi:hypothetical protein